MRTHCITIDLANQGRRQVRARFDGGRMSSDGGALLLQAVDQRIGLTRRLPPASSITATPAAARRAAGGAVPGQPRRGAGGDRLGCGRDRRPAARQAGGAFLPRLLRLLLLPPAVCDLRVTPAVRAAATVQPGRGGRGRGRVAADRGADPAALGGDQPGAGADRDPAAVRAAVLRTRGHGEPDQGAAAGPVRGPDFGGDAAGEPVAAVLGPVRGGAAGGVATTRAGTELARAQCGTIRALLLKVAAVVRVSGRRRRDSLWASGRDSRGATRGGQREVCSPCANSPSRTGRVPRNRSRLTQIWLREGIPERQGREISCRPASNSPLPGPVTPKSEAA